MIKMTLIVETEGLTSRYTAQITEKDLVSLSYSGNPKGLVIDTILEIAGMATEHLFGEDNG